MQELEVLYFVMILKIYNDLQDFEESRRSSEIEKFTKVLNCKILQKYASKFCKLALAWYWAFVGPILGNLTYRWRVEQLERPLLGGSYLNWF